MSRSRAIDVAIWLVGAIALIAHAHRYWPFLADDALISLRYARHLVAGDGLVWNVGERVEGYSNLLFILLAAGLHRLGCDLIWSARAIDMASSLVVLACIVYVSRPAKVALRVAIVLLFAALGSIAVWSIAGLEAMLLGALLAIAWASLLRDPLAPRHRLIAGICFGLAAWTRPDAMIFVVIATGCVVTLDRARQLPLKNALVVIAPAAAMWTVHLCFRLAYYHDYIPNTARVKVEWRLSRVAEGLTWVGQCLLEAAPLVILCAIVTAIMWLKNRQRWSLALLWASALGWLFYIALVGGDIFPAQRHFVPAALALLLVLAIAAPMLGEMRFSTLGFFVVLPPLLALQFHSEKITDAIKERWEFDGQTVALALKQTFGERAPTLATPVAGALPFWSELPVIDTLGLNDAHIARSAPRPVAKRDWLGHTLGDGAYVLSRKPDLIMWCGVYGSNAPCFPSDFDMDALPEFRRDYEAAFFVGLAPRENLFSVWVRVDSPKVGLQIDPRHVIIPAYLLGTSVRQPVVAVKDRWAQPLGSGRQVRVPSLQLTPGRWRISADAIGLQLHTAHGETLPVEIELGKDDNIGQLLTVDGHGYLFSVTAEAL